MSATGNLDWLFTALGWLLGAGGLALGAWALFWDRAKRRGVVRRRCPKCWYDMAGVPGLTCPECGRAPKSERKLRKSRRRWRAAAAGAILLWLGVALGSSSAWRQHGWPALVPGSMLVFIAPPEPPQAQPGLSPAVMAQLFGTRLQLLGTPPPPPAPALVAPSLTVAERLREEAWRRLYRGELREWQAAAFVHRCCRRAGHPEPWSIQCPARWPAGVPLHILVATPVELRPIVGSFVLDLSVDAHDGRVAYRRADAITSTHVLAPLPDQRAQEVHVAVTHRDRVVFRFRRRVNVAVVRDRVSVMDRVDAPESNALVRDLFEARLAERGAGEVVLCLSPRSGLPASPETDLRLVARARILIGEEVLGAGLGWANLGWPIKPNTHVMVVAWAPNAVDRLRGEGVAAARVELTGDAEVAADHYLVAPFEASTRCWTGRTSIPATWGEAPPLELPSEQPGRGTRRGHPASEGP